MNPLTRALIISVLGVGSIFLSGALSGCATGASPKPADFGNMSWDKKTYSVDESSPSSILTFIEWMSLGVAIGIPLDQLSDEHLAIVTSACSPSKPAGMVFNRQRGSLKPTCLYNVPEATFRRTGIIPLLKERGWFYRGKFGSKHVFSRNDAQKMA